MTPDLDARDIAIDLGKALAVIGYLIDHAPDNELVARRVGYELLGKYPKPGVSHHEA